MMGKAVVLDANILIRAVLGKRVRQLIFEYATSIQFFAPDVAFADARKYLPDLLQKRGVDPQAAILVLDKLEHIVQLIEFGLNNSLFSHQLEVLGCFLISEQPKAPVNPTQIEHKKAAAS